MAYKAYAACILVHYPYGDNKDMLLLNESNAAAIVLKGSLRDEPRVRVVMILADEDNPNLHSVSLRMKTSI